MVMLQRLPVEGRENDHVTEVTNGRENGHVTEMVTLMEGKWSYYRGGHFNGGRMVMLEVVSLMEGEWLCYRDGHFNA